MIMVHKAVSGNFNIMASGMLISVIEAVRMIP